MSDENQNQKPPQESQHLANSRRDEGELRTFSAPPPSPAEIQRAINESFDESAHGAASRGVGSTPPPPPSKSQD